jgi:hypothetical protein
MTPFESVGSDFVDPRAFSNSLEVTHAHYGLHSAHGDPSAARTAVFQSHWMDCPEKLSLTLRGTSLRDPAG